MTETKRFYRDLLTRRMEELGAERDLLLDRADALDRHGYFDLALTLRVEAERIGLVLAQRMEERP